MGMVGGCYCGEIRYEAGGAPVLKAQCHCRECQYISGGGPNFFMLMPEDQFQFTQGTPKQFTRSDIENPRTRDFCGTCGTHLLTRLPGRDQVVLKVGTLDDPSQFEASQMAIYMIDTQPFHLVPDGAPVFDRVPSRG